MLDLRTDDPMTKLLIKGGIVLTPCEERTTDIWTEAERISGLGTPPGNGSDFELLDASGCYVTPGLIDLQVNGGPPCDFWAEPSPADVSALSQLLLQHGVTTILPTIITGDIDRTVRTRDALRKSCGAGDLQQLVAGMVRMPGIHLEGPFLSPQRPGVHPPEFLRPLELSSLARLVDSSVVLMTLAPELDPSGQCIDWLRQQEVVVALGHSNASLAEARTSFDRGVSMMTHTFNALPPLHHRTPGAVGAALTDDRVTCCMICDGLHIDAVAAEIILRCKGVASTILVTDIAKIGTSQGGLVGASIYLCEAVRNLTNWGLSTFADAIRMATFNPASALKIQEQVGQLQPGVFADIVVWDRDTLAIKQVIFNGRLASSLQPLGR